MHAGSIVIVEDESDIREFLVYTLEREGFTVQATPDGKQGLDLARKVLPDLVLLDLMLPGMDGTEICRQLKADEETREISVIMVTAKGEESDVVLGLGLGADDYVSKPFSPRELVARIHAVMRRTGGLASPELGESGVIARGPIRMDRGKHRLLVDGEAVEITATEFRILWLMASRPGRVFDRDQIMAAARGESSASLSRSVDAHVRTLRKKLGSHRDLVQTVRAVGYRFSDDEERPA